MMVASYHWHHMVAFGAVMPMGSLGVGVFFVLSGYLITGILLSVADRATATGASRLRATRSFAARRVLRLLPAFVLYVVVITAFGFHGDIDGWFYYVFYLSNFRLNALGSWPDGVSHLWSLSVEEQFYVIAPFATLFLRRSALKKAILGTIALIVIGRYSVNDGWAAIMPPWAFLGLLVGCWLALEAYEDHVDGSWPRMASFASSWPFLLLGYISIGILGTQIDLPSFIGKTNFLLAHVTMAALVWRGVVGFGGFGGAALNSRLMQSIGRVSYGAYLWHFFARELRVRHLQDIPELPMALDFVLLFAITVALAQLSYHLCERWFMVLKDRYPYLPATSRTNCQTNDDHATANDELAKV